MAFALRPEAVDGARPRPTIAGPGEMTRSATMLLVLGAFWGLHLVTRTIDAVLNGRVLNAFDASLALSLPVGMLLSALMLHLLDRTVTRGLGWGLVLAIALSLPVSAVHMTFEALFFYWFSPVYNPESPLRAFGELYGLVPIPGAVARRDELPGILPALIISNTLNWYFLYFGMAALFVGLRNAGRLRAAERRAAQYEALARETHLLALRYQINPHFLFNTLNSISSLILSDRKADAEAMTLGLARFYRTTLDVDPSADIALSEELELQEQYLKIESVRFPRRLKAEFRCPEALAEALVPPLLLQPLIENAVKHGVAGSRAPVAIRVLADSPERGRVRIIVENGVRAGSRGGSEAGDAAGPRPGGVGLENAKRRLETRFGGDAEFSAGLVEGDRFRVEMRFPLVRA